MSFFHLLISALAFAGSEFDGNWKQPCVRGYQKEELFLAHSATYTEHNFRDVSCLTPSVDLISRGSLIAGAPLLEPLGASELDFIFSSVSLAPRDAAAAEFYESVSLCGLSGWRLNEEKEITGLACDLFGTGLKLQVPSAGDRKYGIVKREGESLYLGRLSPERDGNTALRRPRDLDPVAYRLAR